MNKKNSIILSVLIFVILILGGSIFIIKGSFPFGDTLLQVSASTKGLLYLATKTDQAIIEGTFDMGATLYVPEEDGSEQISEEPESLPGDLDVNIAAGNGMDEQKVDLDLSSTTGYLVVGDTLMQMCTTYEENLAIYAGNLNRLQSQLPDKTVISMVVPNSFPFYAPTQYITASVNQEEMIYKLYSELNPNIKTVDAFSVLNNNQQDYNYFRTDHHWTAKGAYHAYTAFCETMGLKASPLPKEPSGVFTNYIGSLYNVLKQHPQANAALKNPDYIEYYMPKTAYTAFYYSDASMKNGKKMKVVQPNLSSVDDKYLVFLEGLRPVIHVNTEVKNGRSILIIKDSYANAFVPFMLENYEDIYVVDFRNFNAPNLPAFNAVKFVQDNNIDEIMFANYPYVPNDRAYSEHIGRMVP